jgi:hypothetical protein
LAAFFYVRSYIPVSEFIREGVMSGTDGQWLAYNAHCPKQEITHDASRRAP